VLQINGACNVAGLKTEVFGRGVVVNTSFLICCIICRAGIFVNFVCLHLDHDFLVIRPKILSLLGLIGNQLLERPE
jgi:hypothetical protein